MAKAPDPFPPEVIAALERRQPVEAFKLLLRLRASGLAAPKAASRGPAQAARSAAAPVAPPSPTTAATTSRRGLSPGEVPRSQSSFWAWLVVGLLAFVAYRLFGP